MKYTESNVMDAHAEALEKENTARLALGTYLRSGGRETSLVGKDYANAAWKAIGLRQRIERSKAFKAVAGETSPSLTT